MIVNPTGGLSPLPGPDGPREAQEKTQGFLARLCDCFSGIWGGSSSTAVRPASLDTASVNPVEQQREKLNTLQQLANEQKAALEAMSSPLLRELKFVAQADSDRLRPYGHRSDVDARIKTLIKDSRDPGVISAREEVKGLASELRRTLDRYSEQIGLSADAIPDRSELRLVDYQNDVFHLTEFLGEIDGFFWST
jgi:hypothetical protein